MGKVKKQKKAKVERIRLMKTVNATSWIYWSILNCIIMFFMYWKAKSSEQENLDLKKKERENDL